MCHFVSVTLCRHGNVMIEDKPLCVLICASQEVDTRHRLNPHLPPSALNAQRIYCHELIHDWLVNANEVFEGGELMFGGT